MTGDEFPTRDVAVVGFPSADRNFKRHAVGRIACQHCCLAAQERTLRSTAAPSACGHTSPGVGHARPARGVRSRRSAVELGQAAQDGVGPLEAHGGKALRRSVQRRFQLARPWHRDARQRCTTLRRAVFLRTAHRTFLDAPGGRHGLEPFLLRESLKTEARFRP